MRGVCSWKQEPVCLRRFRACRTGAWTDPVSAPQVPSCPGLPDRQAPAIRYRHSQLVGDTTSSVFGPYGVMPSCWIWAALPRKSRSSAMRPCSRCTTVAMAASVSARRLDHLVSHFMGLVNLTSNTSTVVVHLRGVSVCDNVRLSGANDAHTLHPTLTGCAETFMSGVEVNMAATSSNVSLCHASHTHPGRDRDGVSLARFTSHAGVVACRAGRRLSWAVGQLRHDAAVCTSDGGPSAWRSEPDRWHVFDTQTKAATGAAVVKY